jgi:hypothetical protein
MGADRQTDMTKLIVTFCNFANATNNDRAAVMNSATFFNESICF